MLPANSPSAYAQAQPYPSYAGAQPSFVGPSEHEQVRRAYIKPECNVRSIGVLCIIGGALVLLSSLSKVDDVADFASGIVGGGLALAAGILLRQLHPAGRILYTVLAALALFGNALLAVSSPPLFVLPIMAVQTGVVLLFLCLLWNGRASVVFGAQYRGEIVAATRHVKYVSSPLVIGAFVVTLVATIAGGAIAAAVMLS